MLVRAITTAGADADGQRLDRELVVDRAHGLEVGARGGVRDPDLERRHPGEQRGLEGPHGPVSQHRLVDDAAAVVVETVGQLGPARVDQGVGVVAVVADLVAVGVGVDAERLLGEVELIGGLGQTRSEEHQGEGQER
jgi:hypothetical protein